MPWSITLGRIFGIEIRVHMTFFLLLSWIGAMYWVAGGPTAAGYGVLFVILLFACVVLHELGHAMAARRYGIGTKEITLLPIGGVASLERMPEKPEREIFVAIAGPLVNVVIAGLLIIILGGRIDLTKLQSLSDLSAGNMITQLATLNVMLVVFNLIPAFPMDGGRIFRALLAFWFSYPQATRIAARVGQVIAFGFAFLGLMGNPLLILIALFVFFAASAETATIDLREAARGKCAADAMISSFESLTPSSTIDDAANLILQTTQQEFPVLDEGNRFRGVITREAIVTALAQLGGRAPVGEVMTTELPSVSKDAPLETAVRQLEGRGHVAVAIMDADARLAGYITLENIAELLMIRSAKEKRGVMQSAVR